MSTTEFKEGDEVYTFAIPPYEGVFKIVKVRLYTISTNLSKPWFSCEVISTCNGFYEGGRFSTQDVYSTIVKARKGLMKELFKQVDELETKKKDIDEKLRNQWNAIHENFRETSEIVLFHNE